MERKRKRSDVPYVLSGMAAKSEWLRLNLGRAVAQLVIEHARADGADQPAESQS